MPPERLQERLCFLVLWDFGILGEIIPELEHTSTTRHEPYHILQRSITRVSILFLLGAQDERTARHKKLLQLWISFFRGAVARVGVFIQKVKPPFLLLQEVLARWLAPSRKKCFCDAASTEGGRKESTGVSIGRKTPLWLVQKREVHTTGLSPK